VIYVKEGYFGFIYVVDKVNMWFLMFYEICCMIITLFRCIPILKGYTLFIQSQKNEGFTYLCS